MFNISDYLEKFKKLSQTRNAAREAVAEAVKSACGIEIDPKKIEIRNFTARISEKPIVRSEIFMKKEKILALLAEKIPGAVLDLA